jgi:hypothetical protein
MHDLGFPIGHPPHSKIVTTNKRFEVDGANAARNFLRENGKDGEWDQHRLQLVWDAIALHTIGSIVFEKEAEVQACSYGKCSSFPRRFSKVSASRRSQSHANEDVQASGQTSKARIGLRATC